MLHGRNGATRRESGELPYHRIGVTGAGVYVGGTGRPARVSNFWKKNTGGSPVPPSSRHDLNEIELLVHIPGQWGDGQGVVAHRHLHGLAEPGALGGGLA